MKKRKVRKCDVVSCTQMVDIQRHHYLPKRFYGSNPFFIMLCNKCHRRMEGLIPQKNQLTLGQYIEIVYDFIYRRTYGK